jgi:CRP-like cAMP-binding protein
MDATGVHYRVRFWLRPWIDLSPSAARSRVAELALEQLRQAGLTPAYPKQDVFQAPMPLRQLSGDSSEERVALLCRVALFSRLPEDGLRALATHLTVHDFAEGAVLIRQGDEGDSLFVLVEGLLEVRAVDRERGTELVLGRIAPGQFFGEMSLLAREPRAATVVALTGALAYEIGRPAIEALLEAHPGMADTLSRAAAEHRVGRERASRLSVEQKEEETAGLARQILDRMRAFFRVVLTT